MIDRETLIRIAKFTGLKPFQQEKNYIQTIILKSIYSKVSRELVFKGGTALAFFYGLNRFSEDLDFTLRESLDLNDLLKEIEKDLEALNIKSISKILDDNSRSFSFRIGVEGPLFTKEIERCFVRVEISRREEVLKEVEVKELKPTYQDISPFLLTAMNIEEIVSEKIRAMVWRAKARDLYDLWFLLRKGIQVDFSLVDKKLSYYNQKFDRKKFKESVEKIEGVWKRELRPVVIESLPDFGAVEKEVLKLQHS